MVVIILKPHYDSGTVKPVLSGQSKRTPKIVFQYRLSLNAGQRYCRMLPLEHYAIHATFINLPFSIKFVLSLFKWPHKTCFTVYQSLCYNEVCNNMTEPQHDSVVSKFVL